MGHLSPAQRQLLELRLAGLTAIEIANVMGRSHGTIRNLQHRTLARMRELFGDQDEFGDARDVTWRVTRAGARKSRLGSVLVTLRVGPRNVPDEDAFPLVLGPGITDETLLLQARFETCPDGNLNLEVEGWVMQWEGWKPSMATVRAKPSRPSRWVRRPKDLATFRSGEYSGAPTTNPCRSWW